MGEFSFVEMWQKMVNPGAFPLQSLMFPVLDAKEIEKKIAELEVVEHWLKANLNLLRLSIQSLEYQRSDTTSMGFSLPISPAGIVRLRRVPSTSTPSIVWVPRDSGSPLGMRSIRRSKRTLWPKPPGGGPP